MRLIETKPELGDSKRELLPDSEREVWLRGLAEFIVEANQNTWAAGKGEVTTSQRPGCKELDYRRGDWHLHDSYTGYFRAPGMTIVYYKNHPTWTMAYGGRGMEEDRYDITKPTFEFLKRALLMNDIAPDLPYRGPAYLNDGEYNYQLQVNGDLTDFDGKEIILKSGKLVFSQIIFGGIVIGKDSSRNPVLPWHF